MYWSVLISWDSLGREQCIHFWTNYKLYNEIDETSDWGQTQTKLLQFMRLWHLTSKHSTSVSLYLPLPLPGLVGVWFLCEALLCPPEPPLSGIPTQYEHAQCLFPNLHSAQITLTSSPLWRPCMMQVPIKTMNNKCFRAYHQNTWIYSMSQSLFFLQFSWANPYLFKSPFVLLGCIELLLTGNPQFGELS